MKICPISHGHSTPDVAVFLKQQTGLVLSETKLLGWYLVVYPYFGCIWYLVVYPYFVSVFVESDNIVGVIRMLWCCKRHFIKVRVSTDFCNDSVSFTRVYIYLYSSEAWRWVSRLLVSCRLCMKIPEAEFVMVLTWVKSSMWKGEFNKTMPIPPSIHGTWNSLASALYSISFRKLICRRLGHHLLIAGVTAREADMKGNGLVVNMGRTKILICGPGHDMLQIRQMPLCCASQRYWHKLHLLCGCFSWVHQRCSCIPGTLNPDPSYKGKWCTGLARPVDLLEGMLLDDMAKVLLTCQLKWHVHVERSDRWLEKVQKLNFVTGCSHGHHKKNWSVVDVRTA